ncbi:hypothetical protein [Streptomyces sp. NPDC057336]|uniref:hypothetical protein n=1 Tax=Streptomyces sp. NPDC057336 TaxID=3346102 RepID=UPI0036394B8E
MRLDWPDFRLECDEATGRLSFHWVRFCGFETHVRHCAHVRLVPQGADGWCQWIFQLAVREGPTPGLVVVRVDVPPDQVPEAEEYTDLLRRRFGVPHHREEGPEEEPLERVPQDAPEWVTAPAGAATEELFGTVMIRVAEDTG